MPGAPVKKMKAEAVELARKAADLRVNGDRDGADAAQARAEAMMKAADALLKRTRERRKAPLPYITEAYGEKPRAPVKREAYYPVAMISESPPPLAEGEFGRAACVAASAYDGGRLPDPSSGPDPFLAAAFPTLSPDERVRAARYLSALAAAELRPPKGSGRPAATDCALKEAGLPYVSFEAMRRREPMFEASCSMLEAARRRAVMSMLEEELLERAFSGYDEETLTRDSAVVSLRKHDNRLAYEILKSGHEHYVRVNAGRKAKDAGKGGGGGMTLLINNAPQAPEMKAVEGRAL